MSRDQQQPGPQSPPRGRLHQHWEFQVQDLIGCTLERLLGYAPSNRPHQPEMLFLKPRGAHWQRFFFDAGLGFWEEWSVDDAFDGFRHEPTLQEVDYGTEFQLNEAHIIDVSCRDEPDGRTCLSVVTDKGRFFLRTIVPKSLESDLEVGFDAPPRRA